MASLLTKSELMNSSSFCVDHSTANHCDNRDQKIPNCMECRQKHLHKENSVNYRSHIVSSVANRCVDHCKQYNWYCLYHGVVCCSACITIMHVPCHLKPIAEIIHEMKCSYTTSHLEKYLFDLHVQIDLIVKDIAGKILEKNKNKDEYACSSQMTTQHSLITDYCYKIDRSVNETIPEQHFGKPEMEYILDKALEEREYIHQLQDYFVKVTELEDDFQTFLLVTRLIPQAVEKANSISKIQRDLLFYNTKSKTKQDYSIRNFSLSEGIVSHLKCGSSVNVDYFNKGHHNKSLEPNFILDKVFLFGEQNYKIEITGIEVSPDGHVLLLDQLNKMLIIISSEGRDKHTVEFWSKPFGVCHVNKGTIAVTTNTGSSGEMVLVNIANRKKIKTIQFPTRCFGIDCKNRTIAVRTINRFGFNIEIALLDTENYLVFRRIMIPQYYIEHISLYSDTILCTDPYENRVICYSLNGELLWTYDSEGFLIGPRHITTDRHGFVYVVGDNTCNVLILTPSGDFRRLFVSEQEGFNDPRCVRYNIYRDKMVLCSKHGEIRLYSLVFTGDVDT